MAEPMKIINNPSITSGSFTIDDGKIVAIAGMPLAGSGGGTQSDFVYVPSFNDETGDISFILGVTGAEGKGPWHISGTPGPKGEDGAQGEPGNDACPITAASAEVDDGVHVTISYTSGGNALTEFDILDGYDGNDGKTPEFSANPVNAHLLWKYSGDSNWTDFGFAMSGEKGPQGETGPEGPDGISPTVTTATIEGGSRVIFTYGEGSTESIDVMSGIPGLPGVSPTVTVTNIPADPLNPDHQNGGTEITITDATTTNKFSAWNGNDGTMAGAPDIEGKNGISAVFDGLTYEVGLSSEFYKAVTAVSSKLDASVAASTYATKDALNDYLTKDAAAEAYQPKGNYLSANALNGYATETWVGQQGYLSTIPSEYITETELADYNYVTTATTNSLSLEIEEISSTLNDKYTLSAGTGIYFYEDSINKTTRIDCTVTAATTVAQLTDSANYYTINQTSAASELTTEFAKYALLANIPIKVTDLTDSANYVVTGDILTGTGNKLTGIKIGSTNYTVPTTDLSNYYTKSQTSAASALSAEFAKYLTSVIADTTLTGDGTDNSHKLGVAWSTLSGNTIVSAKSANSTEYITNGIGYSGFNDISAKFDSLTSYVPYSATVLPIGTNNTATNNSIAIGSNNMANDLGFAVGQSNTALKRSLAFGVNNYANDISLAIGYQNTASGRNDNNQSAVNIAIGYGNSAADHAAALINVCTAENYAFAAGHGNSAIDNSVAFGRNTSAYFYSFDFGHSNDVRYYSYAFGRGLHYEGQWEGNSQYGAFVIGGWNATTSYATTADAPLFIVGNGSNGHPSDGFIVYRDGNVSAKQYKAEGYTQNNTYVEASVPKSLPNSGDNAMVVQKMFVCTSDPDILAHVALANGEGCIFFRVGS